MPNHILAEFVRRSRLFEQPHLPSPCLENSAFAIGNMEQPESSRISPPTTMGVELSEDFPAVSTGQSSTPTSRRRSSGENAADEVGLFSSFFFFFFEFLKRVRAVSLF